MQSNSSDNCVHHLNVKIFYIFDPELQLINTKPMIKNKYKKLLSESKKFNVRAILVLEYKKKKMIIKSSIQLLNLGIQRLMKHLNPCIKAV